MITANKLSARSVPASNVYYSRLYCMKKRHVLLHEAKTPSSD